MKHHSRFAADIHQDIDVLFLCVGHGEARKFLQENSIAPHVKIIDLSQDFRLTPTNTFDNRTFIYGLPELNREAIRHATNIANPGCFATAIQLGLLPLAKAGLLNQINTTGITGSTGAGQSLAATSHFSWRANNIGAYKTLTHQHVNEISQSLALNCNLASALRNEQAKERKASSTLSPGVVISLVASSSAHRSIVISVKSRHSSGSEDFYQDAPFTILSKEPIFLKQAVNNNKCVIQLEKVGSKLVSALCHRQPPERCIRTSSAEHEPDLRPG